MNKINLRKEDVKNSLLMAIFIIAALAIVIVLASIQERNLNNQLTSVIENPTFVGEVVYVDRVFTVTRYWYDRLEIGDIANVNSKHEANVTWRMCA